jgi:hypothetical protein
MKKLFILSLEYRWLNWITRSRCHTLKKKSEINVYLYWLQSKNLKSSPVLEESCLKILLDRILYQLWTVISIFEVEVKDLLDYK